MNIVIMKRVYFLVLSTLFTIMTTAEVMAGDYPIFKNFLPWNGGGNGDGGGGGGEIVGAPLDGGLLALLAAAGVTYFVARRKKKNKE